MRSENLKLGQIFKTQLNHFTLILCLSGLHREIFSLGTFFSSIRYSLKNSLNRKLKLVQSMQASKWLSNIVFHLQTFGVCVCIADPFPNGWRSRLTASERLAAARTGCGHSRGWYSASAAAAGCHTLMILLRHQGTGLFSRVRFLSQW